MLFTRYIPLSANSISIDPLGFLRPGSALADLLFHQFTILSNHPCYLGFLCFIFSHFEKEMDLHDDDKRFSSLFREAEVLWGLICLRSQDSEGGAGPGILNINRLRKVKTEEGCRFSPKNDPYGFFLRLEYGTLGHYRGPAVLWGLMDQQSRKLTDSGRQLANAWDKRGKYRFSDLLRQWRENRANNDISTDAYSPYALNSKAHGEEREVWKERIADACKRYPVTAPLWQDPPRDDVLSLSDDMRTYRSFFPSLIEKYRLRKELSDRLRLCRHFEMVAAIAQFVFVWEYMRKTDSTASWSDFIKLRNNIVAALKEPVSGFLELRSKTGLIPFWRLVDDLADCTQYEAVAEVVLEAHISNQRKKNAAPFMDKDRVLIQNRYGFENLPEFDDIDALNHDGASIRDIATWRYRRNWYFRNGKTWREYAGAHHG